MSQSLRTGPRLVGILVIGAVLLASCADSDADGSSVTTTQASSSVPTTQATVTSSTTVVGGATSDPRGTDSTSGDSQPGGSPESLFADFQERFDRSHPFQGLEVFCEAQSNTSELSDPVEVVHIRTRLEQLTPLGFAVEIGDTADQVNVFIDYVNEQCGGVNGRQLNLSVVEVDAFSLTEDIDVLRNVACVAATEDHEADVVINTSAFTGPGVLCITEGHGVPFINADVHPAEMFSRSDGLLFSLSPSLESSLSRMADFTVESGRLAGRTAAVVLADVPGEESAVRASLVAQLEGLGIDVAVVGVVGCNGGLSCTVDLDDIVSDMRREGVDIVFPVLNILSLPALISEMSVQGYEPGDVLFINSDVNAQGTDLVSSKVVAFGGEAAGRLYDGTVVVDDSWPALFRDPAVVAPAFNQMCADTYEAASGVSLDPRNFNSGEYGAVLYACTVVRIVARAVFDAGDSPDADGIANAVGLLGPIDTQDMIPASFEPDKFEAPDVVQSFLWSWPCAVSGTGFGDENNCFLDDPETRFSLVG